MSRLLVFIGGCVVAFGAVLPWAQLDFLPLSYSARVIGLTDLGWPVLLAGLAAPALLLVPALRRVPPRGAAAFFIVAGVASGLLAVARIVDVHWAKAQVTHAAFVDPLGASITLDPDIVKYVQVASSNGLYVVLAGALMMALGGIHMLIHVEDQAASWDVGRGREIVFFITRSKKVLVSASILLVLVVLALVGPMIRPGDPNAMPVCGGFMGPECKQAPSAAHWLGTTDYGRDVFSQFVYGLGSTLLVGFLGGSLAAIIGMAVGFVGGYAGGIVDEILNVVTNVVLVIPTLALLLIAAAYLNARGLMIEAFFIGLTSWPWAARAIRAQTFSLKARDFVDLARLSGVPSWRIIVSEIAPNMASYLFMTFILMFGGAILIASTLDFIGLGPTSGQSLGLMMQVAVQNGAMYHKMWWWFIPPGMTITAIVGCLYVMNVGLDEIFNPKLRKT
jgi:peptide/nickel transport system permease protein